MPPENWCGYWSMRCLGRRDAGFLAAAGSRAGAPRRRSTGRCVWIVSISCRPIVYSGFERGQRILEDRADLAAAHLAHLLVRQVVDAPAFERISPPAMRPGGSSRPMIAAPVSDLPAPDSPTTPRISPGAMSNEMSSSATQRAAAGRELDAQVAGPRAAGPVIGGQRTVSAGAGSARRAASRRAGSRQRDQHQHRAGEDGDPPVAARTGACCRR